jgi:hypothetical protein
MSAVDGSGYQAGAHRRAGSIMATLLSGPMLRSLLIVISIYIISVSYGMQWAVPDAYIPPYFAAFSAGFFLVLLLVLAVLLQEARRGASQDPAPTLVGGVGGLLTFGSGVLTCYFYSTWVPAWLAAAVLIGLAAGAVLAGLGKRPYAAAILQSAAILVLLGWLPLQMELSIPAANMLPVIEAACQRVAAGGDPWITYPTIASVPFYYMPALFMPYCPFVWADIDMRAFNWLCFAGILAACLAFARRGRLPFVSLAILPLLASPMSGLLMVHGHLWLYWLAIVLGGIFLLKNRFVWSAAFFGLACGMRQTAVFLALPLMAVFVSQIPVRTVLWALAAASAGFLVLFLPTFAFIESPVDFFYLSLQQVGSVHNTGGNPANQIAISGILANFGIVGSPMQYLQMATMALGLIAFYLWFRPARPSLAVSLSVVGLIYIFVVALNPFLSRYIYVPGLLLLGLAVQFGREPATGDYQGISRPS